MSKEPLPQCVHRARVKSASAGADALHDTTPFWSVLSSKQPHAEDTIVKPDYRLLALCTCCIRLALAHRESLPQHMKRGKCCHEEKGEGLTSLGTLSRKMYDTSQSIDTLSSSKPFSTAITILQTKVLNMLQRRQITHGQIMAKNTNLSMKSCCLEVKAPLLTIAVTALLIAGQPTGGAVQPIAWQVVRR
jgi:hypothetical protein